MENPVTAHIAEIDNMVDYGITDVEKSCDKIEEAVSEVAKRLGVPITSAEILASEKKIRELAEKTFSEIETGFGSDHTKKRIIDIPHLDLSVEALENIEKRFALKHVKPPTVVEVNYDRPVTSPLTFDSDDTKQIWQFQMPTLRNCPTYDEIIFNNVHDRNGLIKTLETLKTEMQISVSIKTDSSNNYRGYVSFIFLSNEKTVFGIDCLAVRKDIEIVRPLFESTDIEKVTFSGYGVRALYFQFGIISNNVICLEVACQMTNVALNAGEAFRLVGHEPQECKEWLTRPLSTYVICRCAYDTVCMLPIVDYVRRAALQMRTLQNVFMESENECLPKGRTAELKRIISKHSFHKKMSQAETQAFTNLCFWREEVARKEDVTVNEIVPTSSLEQIVLTGASTLDQIADALPNDGMALLYGSEILKVFKRFGFRYTSVKQHYWLPVEGIAPKDTENLVFKHSEWKEREKAIESEKSSVDVLQTLENRDFEKELIRQLLLPHTNSDDSEEEEKVECKKEDKNIPGSLKEIFTWSRLCKRTNKKKQVK
ncbi:hypothetical protein EIN_282120 [Entamoeba invadens IP1]|uniref:HRDC domain-containing protein n=1 Tax=Entamoeba invadens IP1 TaxID=370355 RepID=A0A0A1U043_ENTIV|nr:hypothetical protein EIN_282120 [Entamoeba invadens IP1]ELP85841.1 hypothetical protein EIN_282120 [Entamoeba invadens IP1]|eukprot:XP_004185187.1 hypothetical protein EIN_282120 [Entamoeba invadens IP1]